MKSRSISLTVFLLSTGCLIFACAKFLPGLHTGLAWGDDIPKNATFTTLITTPRAIEGLTGDDHGNLYAGGSAYRLSGLENQSQQPHSDAGWIHCDPRPPLPAVLLALLSTTSAICL